MKINNFRFSFSFLLLLLSFGLLSSNGFAQVSSIENESDRMDDIDDNLSTSMSAEPTDVPEDAITIDRSTVPMRIGEAFEFCGDSLGSADRKALRQAVRQILAKFSADGACNTNICFALDGSTNILPKKFGLQKVFVSLIASLLSTGGAESFFSGVQYSDTTTPIEPPTTKIKDFLADLDTVEQVGMDTRNVAAGLGYCGFQLFSKPTGVLLILGSGSPTVGFDPSVVANRIRPPKGSSPIFAISTAGDRKDFEEIVGKSYPDHIIRVRTCKDIGNAILDFIPLIC